MLIFPRDEKANGGEGTPGVLQLLTYHGATGAAIEKLGFLFFLEGLLSFSFLPVGGRGRAGVVRILVRAFQYVCVCFWGGFPFFPLSEGASRCNFEHQRRALEVWELEKPNEGAARSGSALNTGVFFVLFFKFVQCKRGNPMIFLGFPGIRFLGFAFC